MLQGVYSVEGKTNGFSEFMWLRENFGKKRVVHVDEANRYNYSEFALLRAVQGGDGGGGGEEAVAATNRYRRGRLVVLQAKV